MEYLMFGGIGFCLAWLMALMVLPAVHNRAIRLARKRYEDAPLSIREMRAEKDAIRAGFAAATCELELRIEQLREKTVAHATDLGKKNQLIVRLKQEIETANAALRESETREQAARDELREANRAFRDKDVTFGAAEGEIALVRRELAVKDATLRAAEREIATIRNELAVKDSALALAEREITAIKAEIASITPVLLRAEKEAGAAQVVDVIPLVPPALPHQTARPPLDVMPAPTHLIPSAIPPAPQHDDGVDRAWMEIADAAQRVDARYEGTNQRLRATYAPLATTQS
jgi:hypothetical protein